LSERKFIVQRYSEGNWPKVTGQEPFIVSGPRFSKWAIAKSLEKHNEHRFIPRLKQEIDEVLGTLPEQAARECAASLLLREGIIQALWAELDESVPEIARWELSVNQIAAEIPKGPIGQSVIDLLAGVASPESYRSYVADDMISLVPVQIAQDGL
jgi:hypothetical protein